jgi:cellulose synthase/poly-beta-1,6-N-acetylglucosamine synthase-like glycosyltransferase
MVDGELPSIALVIAAYNEADILIDKIRNTLSLQYPSDKLHVYLVTDGSNDHSNQIVEKFPNIK